MRTPIPPQMEFLQNPKPSTVSLILFLFLINFRTACPFSPADYYLLHCGSDLNTIVDNRDFVSDSSIFGPISLSSTPKISLEDQNPSHHSSILYRTARVFTKPSHYEFQINKKGTHLLRFHFFPFNSPRFNLFDALFRVSANGFSLLSNLNLQNNLSDPVLKEYSIWVDSEKLIISFLPSKESFAYINAIEVISAPEDLVADTARFVDSEGIGNFQGLTKQGLETVYRVNIGGPLVTPFNDSLWRTWIPDDAFVKLNAASKVLSFSGRIKYQIGGASREVAPDSVYNTARVMSNPNISMPGFNITWAFPVSSGYRYLVRMHFCDIASKVLNQLYFNVYVNGYTAYKDLDLSELTTQTLASPFYSDFVVDAGSSSVLNVSVGPSSLSSPERINAILNGLEIWKMNSTMGGISGAVSIDSVVDSRPRGKVGFFMPAVAVMSLLIAASLFVHRKLKLKDSVADSVAWSRLSVDASECNLKHDNRPLSDKLVCL